MQIFSLKYIPCVAALCLSFNALATTTFNPSTNALNIDAILLGGSIYKNVSVTLNSYILNSVGSGAPVNNSFDPQANLLTLGAVTVQGTTYNNVSVGVNSYALNGATPAGTAANCTAPQTFVVGINACVTPMGQKVFGTNTLPGVCNLNPCWTNSMTNGTVKWIATSAMSTGAIPAANSTRPMVFAYYSDYASAAPNTGPLLWQVAPVYADTGALALPTFFGGVNSNPSISASPVGGDTAEIDWVVGTEQGLVAHYKSSGRCYLANWSQALNGWNSFNMTTQPSMTCP